MVRTQIQLPEAQAALLKKMAAVRNTSMAEIIRQSIDFYTKAQQTEKTMDQRRRAMAAAGRFKSGIRDLSEAHDSYLAQAFDE
jgi:hypothetical protein